MSADFDYSPLFRFLRYSINNAGDPFVPGPSLHTQAFEVEVLAWFAKLFRFPWDETWGYVTHGGTEGNLYGLYLARELYPDGLVYYSRDTHYSVPKSVRLLRMAHIVIESQPNGEIDYEELHRNIEAHRGIPPVILANIGTTMKEAVDRVDRIRGVLANLSVSSFYIHADAALSGMTLPFIDDSPPFDFSAGIDSISVSGHKFIGSPIPCGVVLAKQENVDKITRPIEYIGNLDTTIPGSRNGVTPLFLWYAIRKYGPEGFRARVTRCIERAEYALDALDNIGCKAWRNPYAITVVIPRPPRPIVRKWHIAVNGENAHIVIMPNVTTELIDEFVADMRI
ncbi:MAG: L-histidine carboxy-lyase (histamine-forming) [Candidatus Kentron sp. G]|nr:MAG: L-histidine carboxy-lyase (histamine-forming) [Candidatus Kentron sp. G]VFN06116.1 MAG: L-histidine carboxy-lyase (histamine-forming) [Candidatus Kentron sp. G]VFN07290.1 MAG: L-histidine carboxy-lyase (histamine-forming) [Candidatus Kentron sp. G]